MTIDRTTPVSDILSLIGTPKARIDFDAGHGTIERVIDPGDYECDSDYLHAVPGLVDTVLESFAAPASERIPASRMWDDV
jgi:hypothetical protein